MKTALKNRNAARSVVVCGVGGQGIILASDVLARALFLSGFDVKKNEIHGMSQREGSVISFIRFGRTVHSPAVPLAGGDFLLGFEVLEALRTLPYVRSDGTAIVNDQEISPTPVLLGKAQYPRDAKDAIRASVGSALFIKAQEAAKALGNPKAVNTILLGALAARLDGVKDGAWEQSIRHYVKARFVDVNLEAFRAGRNFQ